MPTLQEALAEFAGVFDVREEGTTDLIDSELRGILEAEEKKAAFRKRPEYESKLLEAVRIIEKAQKSRYGAFVLQEALHTSEFPTYFGDVLDRTMLARFTEWVPQFPQYLKTGTFRDLNRNKRITQFRGGSEPLQQIGEFGPYPERGKSAVHFGWGGAKYGADFRVSWHTLLADDMSAFTDLPELLAAAARQAEMRFATSLYTDANGVHDSLIGAGFGNQLTLNPVLSIAAVELGYNTMAQMLDPVTGNPMNNRPAYLVVPPALEITAYKVLNSVMVDIGRGGTTDGLERPVSNFISSLGLKIVVDPFIPKIATSNQNTTWFLFAEPNSGPLGPGLAAAQFDRLQGMEAPLLLQKRPAFSTLSGGDDPRGPLDENEAVTYRCVHAFGGGQLITQAVVGSNGSGA